MKRIPNQKRYTVGKAKEVDFEDMWFLLKSLLISQANPKSRIISKDISTLVFVIEEMNRLEDMRR